METDIRQIGPVAGLTVQMSSIPELLVPVLEAVATITADNANMFIIQRPTCVWNKNDNGNRKYDKCALLRDGMVTRNTTFTFGCISEEDTGWNGMGRDMSMP